ncbi:MAG TPA: hypothetical protein VH134_19030 [Candidatus Dormibacteraeota bacterium]|jgi:hypothetical protein|nr:hypothetical protein [Candidatus Dormibacteraeota bacterium]
MDQLILAARDVVEAWENHTEELDVVIRRLSAALGARSASPEVEPETPELTTATGPATR